MDDLLREFLTETAENLDVVDLELVNLERNPGDRDAIDKIFRLVHTVKGTCGFLGLGRLEAVAHASENLLGKFRDGAVLVRPEAVSIVLESLDCIKGILAHLEATESEPAGEDGALIQRLNAMASGTAAPASGAKKAAKAPAAKAKPAAPAITAPARRPGELSREELDAAFRAADGPDSEGPTPDQEGDEPTQANLAAATAAQEIAAAGRAAESAIANQSIRVNVDVLENLMTMVSELVLTRNQLLEMVRRSEDSEFKVPIQRLSNITAELQEAVMKTRMQPIGNAWQKLPRLVRELGRELGKKIELEMIGAETDLDRQVLELIKDPMTHMVRNSADHGLERPDVRRAAGKSDTGKIRLHSYHQGGHIIIEVSDDGYGLNIEKIKAKAVANGLASEADLEKMSENQIHRFIFHPGFSTATKVTNVSGRGVGMDVVRTNIEQIGGTIELKSTLGKETAFKIKIPLTLAIVSALIVTAGGQRFAIPQISVLELVRTKAGAEHRIERIKDTPVLRLRNQLLPLVRLSNLLQMAEAADENPDAEAYIVVSQVGDQIFGIIVDGVFDTEEIVVKPVASILRNISMFCGTTILGDGSVIMIVDPNGIAATIRSTETEERRLTAASDDRQAQDEDRTALLVFRAGGREPKAVPLSLVTRLEEIEVERIETSNGRPMVQYRGKLMPLVHVSDAATFHDKGRQPILVFTDGERSLGLVVDEIVDIIEDRLNVEIAAERPGLIGSAIVREKATEIIDAGYYLTQGCADWFSKTNAPGAAQAKSVLFVDDSPFFRNLVAPLLAVAGYSVTSVSTAEEALRLKEAGRTFDLIVSDIEMPGTSGLDFARLVKDDPDWGAIPLVALSSLCEPADVQRGLDAGFKDYVAKFDRNNLIATIADRLKNTGVAA